MRNRIDTDSLSRWLFADRVPLVKTLVLTNAITYLGLTLFQVGALARYLGFSTARVVDSPWTLLTYPLVGTYCCGVSGFISLLFACLWLWGAGGSLERSWGTRTFALYFFTMSAVTAAGLLIARLATDADSGAGGLWLPLAGVTVAFAMLNPEEIIRLYFVLPVKLKYVALIVAVITVVSYSGESPIVGLLALSGCAYSLWFVRSGRQFGGFAGRPRRAEVVRVYRRPSLLRKLNPFRWIREWRERKRLRKLFENSNVRDEGPPDRWST